MKHLSYLLFNHKEANALLRTKPRFSPLPTMGPDKKGNRHLLRMVASAMLLLFLANTAISQNYEGYTLYFPQGGNKAYLTDISGTTYHTWTFSSSATTTYATYLLANRVLLRTVNHAGNSFTGGPISGEVQKVDWNGTVLWDYVYSTSSYCTHHDIQAMPNGNVLLIAYERKTATEVTQAGCSQSIEMWPDKIVEIQPSGTNGGTVVWEWHAWDHLVQHYDATKPNYGVVASHPELLNINYNTSKDWMHMNGIDYNEALDQIVFSSHALSEIYVIDHSTTTAQAASHTGGNSGKGGDFLYRWGNPAAYETAGLANFVVVHDAHWVPSDNPTYPNTLCGFNNKGGTGGKTCVDILSPPYNGYNYLLTAGTSYAPSTYAWRYTYTGSVQQNNGNSQQLPNGNTLVCLGMAGLIYELNPSSTQIWSKSVGGTIAQAFRYPPCFVDGNFVATASASPTTIVPGGSTQLNVTNTGGTVYGYSWTSSPSGFTSTLQNPVVSPAVTTVYTATIKNGPCTATASVTVTVGTAMTATASATPSTICSGSGSQLNAAVSGGTTYTYSWSSVPPGFASTLQNPVVSPTVNTTYSVAVTSNGNTVNSSTDVTVTSVSASATPAQLCAGASAQLNALVSGGTGFTYAWSSIPAGFTSGLQNPTVTPTTSTTYFVTATDGNCSVSNSVPVTLNAPFSIQAAATPGSICYGEPSQLSVTASGSAASYTYNWSSNPAGFSSAIQNPSVSPVTTTVYSVLVSDGTCGISATATVNVAGPLNVQATALPQVICAGSSTQLNAMVSGGSSYSYSWSSVPAGFSSNLQNPTANPSVLTTYYLSVQSTPCSASNQVSVTVNSLPVKPDITRSGDTLYSSAASGNQWYFNSVALTGETGSFTVAHQNGSYTVQVTDNNGCSSLMSEAISVTITSLDEYSSSLKIYPNPCYGSVHIDGIPSGLDDLLIMVYDFRGSIVKYMEFSTTVDLSDLTNGMYCLVVTQKGNSIIRRKISLQK